MVESVALVQRSFEETGIEYYCILKLNKCSKFVIILLLCYY